MSSANNLDVLDGADAIAEFVFGKADTKNRRRIYHAAEKQALPIFRIGARICARRSTLTKWIEEQEASASK